MATPYVLILALAGARTGLMTTLKSSGMLLSASICAEAVKLVMSIFLYCLCGSGVSGRRKPPSRDDFRMVSYGEVPTDIKENSNPSNPSTPQDDPRIRRTITPMSLWEVIRTSFSFYSLPAMVSFASDSIVLTRIPKIDIAMQRIISSSTILLVAIVSTVLKPVDKMYNTNEWSAILLLTASVPILTSHAAGDIESEALIWTFVFAALSIIYICFQDYIFTSEAMHPRGLHAQNIIIFGIRLLFLATTLPMGDIPRKENGYFSWSHQDGALFTLLALDGLLLPAVQAYGGSELFLISQGIATALFAVFDDKANLVLWGSGFTVVMVGTFIILRERWVRSIVENVASISNQQGEAEDLP
ncbi:hypothetical protein AAMO2058_001580800 [Amorphochlora amoebiformis]